MSHRGETSYREIRLVLDDEVAELILARPRARNAMTDHVRVVLVRGEGETFSAGGDLTMLAERARQPEADNRTSMRRFYASFLAVREIRVPTIAVLAGSAIGAGLCLALACDLRLAASTAKLAASFVRLGLHPGMGATWLLPRLVGPALAAELLLTGRAVDATEALRMGLVSQVHAPEALDDAVRALATQITAAAPLAVAQTKATLAEALERTLDQALAREADAQAIDFGTDDLAEALKAMAARRAPSFTGR